MLKSLFTALLLLNLLTSCGQTYNETYGRPLVVLIETDPWLMVIGSDVPSFALYESGHIIYRKQKNGRYVYYQVQYSREKTQAFIKSLGITDPLMTGPTFIEAAEMTDQTTNILILNFDQEKEISVYGNLRNPKNKAREKTPQAFLSVYDKILSFEDQNARQWLPDTIEVLATNYSHSAVKPQVWNSKWPNLESITTVKRSEDLYSLYLDKKDFGDFIKLLNSLGEKQAVEINGQKFSLSYRLPFPNLK